MNPIRVGLHKTTPALISDHLLHRVKVLSRDELLQWLIWLLSLTDDLKRRKQKLKIVLDCFPGFMKVYQCNGFNTVFLSKFNFRFPNDPCNGDGSKNGTCYTLEECNQKGGARAGSCAQGYGVCCTCKQGKHINKNFCFEQFILVTVRCGETKNENCTYFEASGTESGACRVKICKCDPNVCQVNSIVCI